MSSRNSLVFETDVNMDGLLSDCSNDSSTSSTENNNNHLSSIMLHQGLSLNSATGLSNNNSNQVMFGSTTQQQSVQQHSMSTSGSTMDKSRLSVKNNDPMAHQQTLSNGGPTTGGQNNNGSSASSNISLPKKSLPPNGKKTKGRVKIKMEFIDNKLRRYTTFSKRKTGIMKKVIKI